MTIRIKKHIFAVSALAVLSVVTILITSTASVALAPPVADSQPVTTAEGTPGAITLTGSDVNTGDTLSFIIVSLPGSGDLSENGTGITAGDHVLTGDTVTYTPDTNYSGSDSFTFKINDGTSDGDVATITITVTPINDLPVADDRPATVVEDTPVAITLTGSDVDPGDTLSFIIVSLPGNGDLSQGGTGITAGDHVLTGDTVTYTPDTNYSGGDSFTFKVNDGIGDSSVATITITVTPTNDLPAADDQPVTTAEDTPVAITLTGSDVDPGEHPQLCHYIRTRQR